MLDYDLLASEYARHRRVHPGVLRDLLTTSGVGAGSRVLEVGCGTGNYVAALESAAGCEGFGLDPSAEMLARARERSPTIELRRGRAEALDFAADTFDLVFSVDVIHHVSGRAEHLREARRVLRPGGKACVATDSEEIIRSRRPLAQYFPETVEVELRRYPPIAELRRLIEAAGFREIEEHPVELTYQLVDARPYRERAYSVLHLISDEAYRRGLRRLERDLRAGPVECSSRYVLLWGTR